MGGSVTVAVGDRDRSHADAAAARVAAFWPGVEVTLGGGTATLVSDRLDADGLARCWTLALLNERLVVDGAARRARLLADLVA